MADKRMLTKKVTDDDNFMNLSSSAQALYLHLSMSADDDGFCNQVSISMFKAHASIQDLEALLEKRYIYQFESGVIVIKHWRMANALRKDRYTPTAFQEELKKLDIKDNGAYTLATTWQPIGNQMATQDRLDKDRLDKNRLDYNITLCANDTTENVEVVSEIDRLFNEFWSEYPKKINKKGCYTSFKRIKNLKNEMPLIMSALSKLKKTQQWTKDNGQFIPNPQTFINQERWKDEHIETREEQLQSLDMSSFGIEDYRWNE